MKMLRITFFAAAAVICSTQAYAVIYLARAYDPNMARWLTRDPIGEPGFQLVQGALGKSQVGAVSVSQQLSLRGERDVDLDGGEAVAAASRPATISVEPNMYGFVLNDPENRIDALGLISFKNCDAKHQSDIQNAWNGMCAMVNDPRYQCCVNRSSLFQLLKRRCSWGNVKFTCKQADADSPCGHSVWSLGIGRGSVVLYENAYDVSKCG